MWTKILQNEWTSGSCFQESASTVLDASAEEHQVRQQESNGESQGSGGETDLKTKHFKWAPSFKDVFDSVKASGPGNDGWAVAQGQTSITAMRANFM